MQRCLLTTCGRLGFHPDPTRPPGGQQALNLTCFRRHFSVHIAAESRLRLPGLSPAHEHHHQSQDELKHVKDGAYPRMDICLSVFLSCHATYPAATDAGAPGVGGTPAPELTAWRPSRSRDQDSTNEAHPPKENHEGRYRDQDPAKQPHDPKTTTRTMHVGTMSVW